VLNKGIVNDFKKVVKREEIVAFNWHIIKLIEGCHSNKQR
jgi:hypothetical protein